MSVRNHTMKKSRVMIIVLQPKHTRSLTQYASSKYRSSLNRACGVVCSLYWSGVYRLLIIRSNFCCTNVISVWHCRKTHECHFINSFSVDYIFLHTWNIGSPVQGIAQPFIIPAEESWCWAHISLNRKRRGCQRCDTGVSKISMSEGLWLDVLGGSVKVREHGYIAF